MTIGDAGHLCDRGLTLAINEPATGQPGDVSVMTTSTFAPSILMS